MRQIRIMQNSLNNRYNMMLNKYNNNFIINMLYIKMISKILIMYFVINNRKFWKKNVEIEKLRVNTIESFFFFYVWRACHKLRILVYTKYNDAVFTEFTEKNGIFFFHRKIFISGVFAFVNDNNFLIGAYSLFKPLSVQNCSRNFLWYKNHF